MEEISSVSLIIATYNWPEALKLSLESISKQTIQPSEIIIADDGSDKETTKCIQEFAEKESIPIIHEWHEDKGFRKAIILNKAIIKASSPYIVQIDGDVILNKYFIEDHLSLAEKGCFIRGTRTILNPRDSQELLREKRLSLITHIKLIFKQPTNALRLPTFFSKIITRREMSGEKVKGCNMSFWKEDLIMVNGYNNDLRGWGHEDEELSCRLVNFGLQKKIIKFAAITFHLYHRLLDRKDESKHNEALLSVNFKRQIISENGICEISRIN